MAAMSSTKAPSASSSMRQLHSFIVQHAKQQLILRPPAGLLCPVKSDGSGDSTFSVEARACMPVIGCFLAWRFVVEQAM